MLTLTKPLVFLPCENPLVHIFVHLFMSARLLTVYDVDVFTSAGRFDFLIVDDDQSHFVLSIVETIDGRVGFVDCVRLYGFPRVSRLISVFHSYSN